MNVKEMDLNEMEKVNGGDWTDWIEEKVIEFAEDIYNEFQEEIREYEQGHTGGAEGTW